MSDPDPTLPGRPCDMCGLDPAEGYARINDRWYCHGDESEPTCYEMSVGAWGVRRT